MKKRYLIFIILAVIAALFLGALKAAPSIAKNYIVEHSEEFIGRKLQIAKVNFNPFNFVAEVDSFCIFELDKKTPFISFEKFRINLNPSKIISKQIDVGEIYLKGLYTNVTQNGSTFNFSDILEKFADTTKSTPDTLKLNTSDALGGFSVTVKNITLEKGNIIYQDKKVGSKIHLEDFSVEIPAVYFSDKNTDIGVNLKFANGGDLNVKVLFNLQNQDFNVNVDLNNFALSIGKPYLNDFINYKDFEGFMTSKLNITGNINDILSSNVNGTVAIDSVYLTEMNGKSLGANHVAVGIKSANLNQMDFVIDSVLVNGAYAHLDLYKNEKTNLDDLIKQLPKDTTTKESKPKAPLKFVVHKLHVYNTNVFAEDHTLKQRFNYKVSNIAVTGENINFNNPCSINVNATLQDGGAFALKYKGTLSDLSTMNAYISVKNLALKNFTPYSHHFTGYPITSGTMAFASENKMEHFNVESKNTIDIYNINVGDKDGNTDPEYMVPMKVGLYILKDKDDKIQFDVPVKGNIKDPEFSYFKIIWKTVMNLLIKVAVSPLKIVGNMAVSGANAMGLDLGKNDEIIVDGLSETFTSEQFEKAQKMVEILNSDKNFKLIFEQSFALNKTVENYKVRKLKTEFYKTTQNKTTLNELDQINILAIEDKDSAFVEFAKNFENNLNRKILEKEIFELAEKRNAELMKILKQQPGVTSKNLTIRTAKRSALLNYKGKALYKVIVDIQ